MTEKKSAWSAFLTRYRDDPAGFSEHVIKMQPLPWQREVMDAIAAGERRISVRSGHGVGKSSCAASIILSTMTCLQSEKQRCHLLGSHWWII